MTTMVEVHDLALAVRRAQAIEKALKGAHPEEARSILAWTLARIGRGSGLTKCEFAGRVLSDFENGWKFQTLNRVPVLP